MTDIQNIQIIGIDCAADPENIGIAYAAMVGARLTVEHVELGASGTPENRSHRLRNLANDIVTRIREAPTPTLLALDAPLGWPIPMGDLLSHHTAGGSLPGDARPESLFRRGTDRFIDEKLGKTPIEVGANLIARVTHTALRLIGMIRSRIDGMATSPLQTNDSLQAPINFIEVYPALAGPHLHDRRPVCKTWTYWNDPDSKKGLAGALKAKKRESKDGGERLAEWCDDVARKLSDGGPSSDNLLTVSLDPLREKEIMNKKAGRDHGLDAILCAWTAFRFLHGRCLAPEGRITTDQLNREGWIWFDSALLEEIPETMPHSS